MALMIPTSMLLGRGGVLPVMEHADAQPTASILGCRLVGQECHSRAYYQRAC
jgi:hypothetical protein